jgi:hypothetical protein
VGVSLVPDRYEGGDERTKTGRKKVAFNPEGSEAFD